MPNNSKIHFDTKYQFIRLLLTATCSLIELAPIA